MIVEWLVIAAVHAPPPAPLQGGNGSVRGGLGAAVADGEFGSLLCQTDELYMLSCKLTAGLIFVDYGQAWLLVLGVQ